MGSSVSTTKAVEGFTIKVSKFFRGVWSELKKVHWPSRRGLLLYTAVVLISVVIVGVVIWMVDSVFSFLLSQLFRVLGR